MTVCLGEALGGVYCKIRYNNINREKGLIMPWRCLRFNVFEVRLP